MLLMSKSMLSSGQLCVQISVNIECSSSGFEGKFMPSRESATADDRELTLQRLLPFYIPIIFFQIKIPFK